ncbi:hypothetical protein [Streptomyces sp. NPDC060031]|uniref:hypothetical protein n=1 Tax=Streptomyces sp. NPDC060031 TaxID=3347043 RepID=UPI0036B1619A
MCLSEEFGGDSLSIICGDVAEIVEASAQGDVGGVHEAATILLANFDGLLLPAERSGVGAGALAEQGEACRAERLACILIRLRVLHGREGPDVPTGRWSVRAPGLTCARPLGAGCPNPDPPVQRQPSGLLPQGLRFVLAHGARVGEGGAKWEMITGLSLGSDSTRKEHPVAPAPQHHTADELIPRPERTAGALRVALARVDASRLDEMQRTMDEAFSQAIDHKSLAPIQA